MPLDLDWSAILSSSADKVLAGFVGGLVVALLTAAMRYLAGRRRAKRMEDADFHIAATLYTPIDPGDPDHARYADAHAAGKTHVQELLWLGPEIPLSQFLVNPYVLHQASRAMGKVRDAGILLGVMPEMAERPFLKKLLGHHNTIPATDLVRLYKDSVGTGKDGRVHGIAPPTYENYAGSPHRRVIRAMFVAQGQMDAGLPERGAVHFRHEGAENRYDTIQAIIRDYRRNPERYARCRAYF